MAITIQSFTGGEDGEDLVGCSFDYASGSTILYNFYDTHGDQVTTEPPAFSNGEKIKFSLDGLNWTIKDYDLLTLTPGKWDAKDPDSAADTSDGEQGTFQVQSGVEEVAKTAQAQ